MCLDEFFKKVTGRTITPVGCRKSDIAMEYMPKDIAGVTVEVKLEGDIVVNQCLRQQQGIFLQKVTCCRH